MFSMTEVWPQQAYVDELSQWNSDREGRVSIVDIGDEGVEVAGWAGAGLSVGPPAVRRWFWELGLACVGEGLGSLDKRGDEDAGRRVGGLVVEVLDWVCGGSVGDGLGDDHCGLW
jgi:hypothetical protein